MADVLAAELAKAQVKDEHIVSFEGKGLKLDDASTGKIIVGNTAFEYVMGFNRNLKITF